MISGYDTARAGWNHLYSSAPEAIVFCTDTADVVNALTWARRNTMPIRVRSGRHSLEGWSNVDGGLVIDVSGIKSAEIDSPQETATVGAGLNQLEAVTALGRAGLAAPTGTEGGVGLGGPHSAAASPCSPAHSGWRRTICWPPKWSSRPRRRCDGAGRRRMHTEHRPALGAARRRQTATSGSSRR